MNKKYQLTVDKWLSEIAQQLMQSVVSSQNRECIITGAMSIGKTTFIKETVAPTVKNLKDRWLVLVLPGVIQLYQLNEDGIPIVCDGYRFNDTYSTGTTPDSLPKIINRAKELNKKVWLVVDEAHAIITSSSFRKSFLNIRRYAKECEQVLYMTATDEPLIGMDMGDTYEITRRNSPEVPVTILEVDKLNVDTVYKVVADKYDGEGVVYTHWNDINNNNLLATKLEGLCRVKEKHVLVEEFQENLLGNLPKYKILNDTKQAVSLHAKNKDHPVTQGLIKGNIPEEVAIMCMTSFVKEGLNISNKPKAKIVIVWDKGLSYAGLMQIIGRYRKQDNIESITVLVTEVEKAKKGKCSSFEDWLENVEARDAYEKINQALNILHKTGSLAVKDVLKGSASIYDEETDSYVISEEILRGKLYADYCNELRRFPTILKKKMEHDPAINLKVSIETLEPVLDTELADMLKMTKKEQLQIFQDAVAQICVYDNQTIEEILTNTIDQRRFENREAIENMEIYHQLVGKKFLERLECIERYCEMEKAEAFKFVVSSDEDLIDKTIAEQRAIDVNRVINSEGIESSYKTLGKLKKRSAKPIARQVFVRYQLQDLEPKQGRLSKKRLKLLAQQMIDEGYYSGKKINLEKALPMLEQDLQLVYHVGTDKNGYKFISKIKL